MPLRHRVLSSVARERPGRLTEEPQIAHCSRGLPNPLLTTGPPPKGFRVYLENGVRHFAGGQCNGPLLIGNMRRNQALQIRAAFRIWSPDPEFPSFCHVHHRRLAEGKEQWDHYHNSLFQHLSDLERVNLG